MFCWILLLCMDRCHYIHSSQLQGGSSQFSWLCIRAAIVSLLDPVWLRSISRWASWLEIPCCQLYSFRAGSVLQLTGITLVLSVLYLYLSLDAPRSAIDKLDCISHLLEDTNARSSATITAPKCRCPMRVSDDPCSFPSKLFFPSFVVICWGTASLFNALKFCKWFWGSIFPFYTWSNICVHTIEKAP